MRFVKQAGKLECAIVCAVWAQIVQSSFPLQAVESTLAANKYLTLNTLVEIEGEMVGASLALQLVASDPAPISTVVAVVAILQLRLNSSTGATPSSSLLLYMILWLSLWLLSLFNLIQPDYQMLLVP